MYCSVKEAISNGVIVKHFKQPFISVAANFNHELIMRNLQMTSVLFDRSQYFYMDSTAMLKTDACYQYPKIFKIDDSFCAMYLLGKRLNFTISKFKTFHWMPAIYTRIPVTSQSLAVFGFWLSYFVAQDEFAFMSASLHTNVTAINVYFEPFALSSWLLVVLTAAFLSILLTLVKFFRQISGNQCTRLIYNLILVTKNLIDQPTSTCETNGIQFRVNTLIMCLWCFCCMHANHAYKAAVFSGSHFHENNG